MADDFYTRRLFQVEGGGDPYAPDTGSNRGMGQFSPDLERRYGITDANRTDPAAQAAAVAQERAEHAPQLARVLGRDPSPGESYLAHQQGVGGAIAHFTNPDQPAWQSMLATAEGQRKGERWARAAIAGNPYARGMDPNVSSGDFARGWINKFEQGGPQTGAGSTSPAGAPAVAPAAAAAPPASAGPGPGMLAGASLPPPGGGPDLGMLMQTFARPRQQMPAPPPIDYAVPAALRARLAALGQRY